MGCCMSYEHELLFLLRNLVELVLLICNTKAVELEGRGYRLAFLGPTHPRVSLRKDWGRTALLKLPIHITNNLCSPGLAAGQSKVHRNLRLDFDRFAIQNVRLVLPLLYRFDGCRRQHGMATDQTQILDSPIFADLGLQQHTPLDACLASQRWIIRLYFANQQSLSHTLRHANTLRRSNLGHSDRGGADNASDDASHLSTRDSTWYTADNPSRHDRRRRFFFLNHLYFLWNLGRCAELVVDDISLYLLYDSNRSGGGWRRRWWRRRRNQECH